MLEYYTNLTLKGIKDVIFIIIIIKILKFVNYKTINNHDKKRTYYIL